MTSKPDWMERREFLRLSAAGITFAACTREASAQMRDGASAKTPGTGRKVLLVFFSRAGENYFNGGRKVLAVGNTEVFPDWAELEGQPWMWPIRETYDPLLVRRPQTWLLREGWLGRGGPISAREIPSRRR
jgi:hypothetical protein